MIRSLVFSLIIFISHSSFSQVDLSVKGGLNYTNIIVSNPTSSEGENFKIGFHLGISSEFEITEKIYITSELLYSLKGFKPEGGSGSNAKVNFNYINSPVLLGYNLSKRINVHLGPEFGYLFSAKFRGDSNTADINDFYNNNFDFGVAVGLGFSITEKLSSQFRYVHGLTSVVKDAVFTDDGKNVAEVKYYNRAFQLSLSYKVN